MIRYFKNYLFKSSLCVLWCIPVMALYGQNFDQPDQPHFKSVRQGLSHQFVRCMLKDSKGFMWFGTQNGLTRYDGVNFVVYENIPGDTTSLSYNNITAIFEDRNKNLWVSTFLGLNRYNRENDNFVQLSPFQNSVISAIGEDIKSNLWIGTIGSGIIRYNHITEKVDSFIHTGTDMSALNSNHITSIVIDKENRLWVGTWQGLFLMDSQGKTLRHFQKEPGKPELGISDNYVNALTLEHDSILWIGTLYGGLDKLTIRGHNFNISHYLSKTSGYTPPSILSILADKQNNLWIGVENSGLLRMNTKTGKFNHYTSEEGNLYTLNSNLIRSLYIDDLNILWIGTVGSGVNYLDNRNKQFDLYKRNLDNNNSVCGDDIRCFAEDNKGNIWIGTYNGISEFNSRSRHFITRLTEKKNQLTSDAVNALAFDSQDNLWIGTMNQGIDRYNHNLQKAGNYKIKGIQKVGENKISILYVDRKDNLWVGTSGSGLFRYDKTENTFKQIYNDPTGVGANEMAYVFSILETSDGLIWVGTAHRLFCLRDSGNYRYSIRIFANDTSAGSIKSNYIDCLYEDHKKNLWIGSIDHGLFLYDKTKDSFKVYTVQDGLPDNSIQGILEDNSGDLWISTAKGISRFKISEQSFTNYNAKDGLISDEFNTNSCLKNRDGMLLFGSGEGFNCFYPENIRVNSSVRPVLITDFKIFNQSVPIQSKGSPLTKNIGETRKVILKYKQSSFSIEFVALNYIRGSKSQYSYILEGLEDNWNVVNNKIAATYSYVPPGKYLFKVLGSNNDGIWNNTPATLEIVVLPPWWKSKLAFGIYILIGFAVITAIFRYRLGRVKQLHLAELNQMKLQFLANISHELRTPLSLIISPVENLYARVSDNLEIKTQLDHIHRNANRLFRLINELLDFSKIVENKLSVSVQEGDIVKFIKELSDYYNDEAARRQINYQVEAEPDAIKLWFDPDKIEKIILNLLSNAFKFTRDGGTISIKIEKLSNLTGHVHTVNGARSSSGELLKITVTDNGRGIMPADLDKIFERFYQGNHGNNGYMSGSGIGLSLAKSLVELHHGRIYAESEVGKGTCFTILLPLGNSHFKKAEIKTFLSENNSNGKDADIGVNDLSPKVTKLSEDAPLIILAEDNFELRKYISDTLSKQFRIVEAGNGEDAYRLAVETPPDLVISDIIMPVVSGIELCRQLKSNIITSHIPVVLLTARTTLEDKITGIETGADAYITKPFSMTYLESVTRNLIETRRKIFKRFSQEVYILPKEMTGNSLDQELLEKIIQYVEENIVKTDLSVEELANYLLMSPGHTWRKVKSLTGMTTNEFVRVIRLKKAIKMMEEGNYNISEIAYKVGFSSPAYFTKCFKEQYGKLPSSYLNQGRNRQTNMLSDIKKSRQ